MSFSKSKRRRIRKFVKRLRASAARARAWAVPSKLAPYYTPETWEQSRINVEATLNAAADSVEASLNTPK